MKWLPGLLSSRDPGWTESADVIVVGSGIAGLTAALRLRGQVERIAVVTKDVLAAGSTQWAQGGIAAALGPEDTPEQHEVDTLVAGAGGCDLDAVRVLVSEGPDAVRELIDWGANFDKDPAGNLSLTREGGHHRDRIAHANGDATGAEIQRALIEAVKRAPEILVFEHAMVVDLVTAADGGVAGLTIHVMGEGDADGVGLVRARAVVLASGGLGQVFSQTTNPAVSTADGMAIALRAGARLRDLEFVQFHPTVMYLGPDSRGQQPLISEAVRGEGAFLVDGEGNRFMQGVHPLADLAPRDIVSKAIMKRMLETGQPNMWLDARHLGLEPHSDDRVGGEARAAVSRFWERRFPNILASCRAHGVDPVTELIPVAPACHYASGGVHTDLWGRSSVPGLYATGEVACSGVHGANRLASNSLLEGLVFSRRIAEVLPGELRLLQEPAGHGTHEGSAGLVPGSALKQVQEIMSARVGVLRNAAGVADAVSLLGEIAATPADTIDRAAWEATNVLSISLALADSALRREETRGSHWREDHPERDDAHWAGHFDTVMSDGAATLSFSESPATDPSATEGVLT
ncbi:L-aspartate oxidase [Nocardioides terrae]|uniref:L-aspartate oxidase n=1 Tax=Nocardioides terrae TaxID=574651 RepID=A0A1I1H8R5_9ACTN|nr:L-aspartate oxidase [Nocardioides terrae]SFC20387.1 L-aspartate oxidase [Nocardioides terrae]